MTKTDSLLQQAIALHQQDALDDAEAEYLFWLQQHPDDVQALDLLAILYAQQGQYEAAQEQLIAALTLQPSNSQLLNHLGQVLFHLGQFDQAIIAFTQALTIEPCYSEATINLGKLYEQQGQVAKARTCYQALLERQFDQNVQHCLALNLLNDHLPDAAKALWQEISILDPEHFPSQFFLGTIAYEAQQYSNAVLYFQTALNLRPHHVATLSNLGAVYLKLGQKLQAIQLFETALSLEPENLFALTNLAATLVTEGQIDAAIKQYYQLLTAIPNDFTAHYNLGSLFMQQQKWESAYYHLQAAVTIDPNSFAALSNLGNTLLKCQQRDAAIACYQQALTLQPNNASIAYILQALTGQGNPTAAPTGYVMELFDHYACYFETEVLDKLQYRVPQLLYQHVKEFLLEAIECDILDLGCGTGLCGQYLKSHANSLIGIDLSANMLSKASEKQCYTQLMQADMVVGMQQLSSLFDLIIAADAIVYLGDLKPLFSQAKALLKAEGILAFSIETSSGKAPYQLQPSGRFAHSSHYIWTLAQEIGLLPLVNQTVELRHQAGKPVVGAIVVLRQLA